MRIAEIYESIQGEGLLTGVRSVFVRTSGCNLRCWFCDTPYASWAPEGDDLSVDEVVERTLAPAVEHVVVTGGEPLLFGELVPLTQALRAAGRRITIETAGTLYLPVACDLMSISPKLAGSAPRGADQAYWRRRHEAAHDRPQIVRRLMEEYDHQLKFVVERPSDVESVDQFVASLGAADPDKVWLMPEGVEPSTLAAPRLVGAGVSSPGLELLPQATHRVVRAVRGA